MKLSVIIPVYNEKDTIVQLLKQVNEVAVDKEIIVVDDCSDDGTRQILMQEFKQGENFKIILLDKNQGKGSAIRSALLRAKGDFIVIQDADLEYEPRDYLKLLEPLEKGKACVVYGSRFLGLSLVRYFKRWFQSKLQHRECDIGHVYCSNFLGIQFLNALVFILYGTHITDEATCYKMFRADILKNMKIRCKGFEFCPEVTARSLKMGYKIREVPISYFPRTTEHGKKIGWRDGLTAIFTLIKYRFID